MENHAYAQVLNNPNMPFIGDTASTANIVTDYREPRRFSIHPLLRSCIGLLFHLPSHTGLRDRVR
jgi:hypothetical protein